MNDTGEKDELMMPNASPETTDVGPRRSCRLGEVRIVGLARCRANEFLETRSPIAAWPGQVCPILILVRDRFPIRDLAVAVESELGGDLCAHPLGWLQFPEGATALPDPVLEEDAVDVPAHTTQSFLLRLPIPGNASPGVHRLEARLISRSHGERRVDFAVEIFPASAVELTSVDLGDCIFWPHWQTVCRRYGTALWSEAFWTLADRFLEEMAAGGMTGIMVSLNDDPFRYPLPEEFYHHNLYPGMIRWIRRRDGSFRFDYTVYDRYVELNLRHGIDREIECHALLPCKMQNPWITYEEEEGGAPVAYETACDAPEYIRPWEAFLRDFAEHNRRKGWLGKLAICPYDEPGDPVTFRRVARMAKAILPEARITAACDARALDLADVIETAAVNPDPALGFTLQDKAALEGRGVKVGWYNCLRPADWGNTLLSCALGEAYRMPWITAANGFSGYLRWSIVNWTWDPWREPAFNWPTGDMYLLYPGRTGPATGLRWEAYKAGRADLRLCLAARRNARDPRRLNGHLAKLGHLGPIDVPPDLDVWRRELYGLVSKATDEGGSP
jgi:hypothetical protein